MKSASRDPRWIILLLSIAISVHIIFCLSLHYKFLNPLFYITTHAKGQAGPFFGIYQAGVNLLKGESIYGNNNYRAPSEISVPYYHFYRYLPFSSYLSSIVSRVLKPWPAYWAWIVFNEVLLGICIFLTIRLRHIYGRMALAVSAFWLLYSPVYVELYMGQFCFTMAFFIFLILYPYLREEAPVNVGELDPVSSLLGGEAKSKNNDENERDSIPSVVAHTGIGSSNPGPGPHTTTRYATKRGRRIAFLPSLSWVLSVLLKSFTAVYSLTLIRIGKKKLVLTGIAAAILTSVPYYLKQPQDLKWFLRLNLQPLPSHVTGGSFGFNGFLRETFNHLIPFFESERIQLGFFDVAPRNLPLLMALAAIIIVTLLITVRQKRIDPLSNITLWTLTFFLVFKDIWEYHYVMLIPLFVAFYLKTRSKLVLVLFIILAAPTPFLLYDVPASNDPQVYWSAPLSILHHSFKAVPTFIFYLWVLRRELKEIGGFRRLFSFRRATL